MSFIISPQYLLIPPHPRMESTRPPLNLHKWLLCLICGFIGIFLLSLYCSDHGLDLHLPPYPHLAPQPYDPNKHIAPSPRPQFKTCNLFEGKWVYDPQGYPLYSERKCPFLSRQVTCQMNGRPDSDYMHWRWEAQGCSIPRFNGTDMLERLRGKRVVIVGDSLNRNQWESLACLLYSSLPPSRTIVKNGDSYKLLQAMDYECSVEFYWSPFLVNMEETQTGDKVLKLDHMPPESRRWKGAHVLVFNTGHWWTHSGRMRSWKYYERKGILVEDMQGDSAYEIAMQTWARWIDRHVNPSRTRVFFRSVSPEHKRVNGRIGSGQWLCQCRDSNVTQACKMQVKKAASIEEIFYCKSSTFAKEGNDLPSENYMVTKVGSFRPNLHWCYNQTNPITSERYIKTFPSSMVSIVERTIQEMRTRVTYLNVTGLSELRRDGHTSLYTTRHGVILTNEELKSPEKYADCSHWCLPGIPDTWNTLLYAFIVRPPSATM